MPLAARVCYDVKGLQFSFQADKFQDIVKYTDGNLGPLLAVLCGYCWFAKVSCQHVAALRPLRVGVMSCSSVYGMGHVVLSLLATAWWRAQVVNELESCLGTIRAVATLHTHGKTSFQWTNEDGERWTRKDGKTPKVYRLKSVGSARFALFLLAQTWRLAIACALCYGGSYFIAHTIALGDLILNCVALEVRITPSPPYTLLPARKRRPWDFCALSVRHGSRRAFLQGLRPQTAEESAGTREDDRDQTTAQVVRHGLGLGAQAPFNELDDRPHGGLDHCPADRFLESRWRRHVRYVLSMLPSTSGAPPGTLQQPLRRRSTRLGVRHRQGALQRAVQCRALPVFAPSLACRAVPSLGSFHEMLNEAHV